MKMLWIFDIKILSSRREVFCKKGILRNFTTFSGKHLCQSLFLNKVAHLRSATLLKKRLWHRFFPVNFAKCLRTPFLIEHFHRLFLHVFIYLHISCNILEKTGSLCPEYFGKVPGKYPGWSSILVKLQAVTKSY